MAGHRWSVILDRSDGLPVFDGMDKVGLTGRDIADAVGVTAPTISKWRNSRSRIPDDSIAFLTLVLGNRIEELQNFFADLGAGSGSWQFQARAGLHAALDDLQAQERLNRVLPTDAVREGSKRFRHWWVAKGRQASVQMPIERMASDPGTMEAGRVSAGNE